jgi:FKBP-type peptidyl-prolyl cis-trans isomerase 2
MAMENAAQGHTTGDEEEVTVELNWQFGDSNNNGLKNSGSY